MGLEIKPPFECPLCGAEDYEQVEIIDSRGMQRKSLVFQCRGCTVLFRNRDKFTRHRKQHLTTEQLYRLMGRTHD